MPKIRLRDLVVILPGITGSVLEKDGRPLWAPTWGALSRTAVTGGKALETLTIRYDDTEVDDLGDGVTATRLVPTAHLVPGLVKIDGYTELTRLVTDHFAVAPGQPGDPRPANCYPFPYDWRRDLRVIAHRLADFVAEALPRWRAHSGARDAKVIVLAHSMGGLVARYWLEVLGGAPHCRALITFGTPHRGSLRALDFLANGYRRLHVDLTDVMRSFTSVHQLLPIYPCVLTGGDWWRPAEAGPLPGVSPARAGSGLLFHREIEQAVQRRHRTNGHHGYATIPVVGSGQRTAQSAVLARGSVRVGLRPPGGLDPLLSDGDGTVPRASAVPIELSTAAQELIVPERHSFLHNNLLVLNDLRNRLTQLQVRGLSAIRGPTPGSLSDRPGIDLDLHDAYLAAEPVVLRAKPTGEDITELHAAVEPADRGGARVPVPLTSTEDGWEGAVTGLTPGLYRAEVTGPLGLSPIHDLFEVLP